MALPLTTALSLRLLTIQGHVRAVERLVSSGRTLDAVAQLRAVKAALGEVAREALRDEEVTAEVAAQVAAALTPRIRRALLASRPGVPYARKE